MARVEVYTDRVVVRLTLREKVLAVRTRDVVLQRSAITSALITHDPWVWLRGVRSPGSYVTHKLAVGARQSVAGNDFTLIRKGRAAVVLDLEVPADAEQDANWISEFDSFSRVILSSTRAAELITALRLTHDEVYTTPV